MNIDQILDEIKSLSHSQGFYGRLYERLMEIKNTDEEEWRFTVEELESRKFKDTLDMVMYFEG